MLYFTRLHRPLPLRLPEATPGAPSLVQCLTGARGLWDCRERGESFWHVSAGRTEGEGEGEPHMPGHVLPMKELGRRAGKLATLASAFPGSFLSLGRGRRKERGIEGTHYNRPWTAGLGTCRSSIVREPGY